jgi:hypothetical protein
VEDVKERLLRLTQSVLPLLKVRRLGDVTSVLSSESGSFHTYCTNGNVFISTPCLQRNANTKQTTLYHSYEVLLLRYSVHINFLLFLRFFGFGWKMHFLRQVTMKTVWKALVQRVGSRLYVCRCEGPPAKPDTNTLLQ